jgi:hypothetical protein
MDSNADRASAVAAESVAIAIDWNDNLTSSIFLRQA